MRTPECLRDQCDKPSWARGLCATHYWHAKRGNGYLPPLVRDTNQCIDEGCDRPPPYPKGRCNYHYRLFVEPNIDRVVPDDFPEPGPRLLTAAQAALYDGRPDRCCSWCGRVLPVTEFYACVSRPTSRDAGSVKIKTTCRRCLYYHRPNDGPKHRRSVAKGQREIRRRYGITMERREQMSVEQGGLCAICRKRSARVIDHCHATGVVRGLLCHSCNTCLHIMEEPELYRAAVAYLERARTGVSG